MCVFRNSKGLLGFFFRFCPHEKSELHFSSLFDIEPTIFFRCFFFNFPLLNTGDSGNGWVGIHSFLSSYDFFLNIFFLVLYLTGRERERAFFSCVSEGERDGDRPRVTQICTQTKNGKVYAFASFDFFEFSLRLSYAFFLRFHFRAWNVVHFCYIF